MKRTFVRAQSFRVSIRWLIFDWEFYLDDSYLKTDEQKLQVAFFWMVFVMILVWFGRTTRQTFRDLNMVTGYLNQADSSDEKLDTNNDLKNLIWPNYLEKPVTTIENKMSIGMIEKRHKYFKDAEKTYNFTNESTFVIENKDLMMSLARLFY